MRKPLLLPAIAALLFSCHPTSQHFDTLIKNAQIYDGTGAKPVTGDIAIQGDTIAAIGDLSGATAPNTIDATNKAVSPGFIDLQSQFTDTMKAIEKREQGDIKYDVDWTSLKDYLPHLQKKGVSTNVASFVGA